MGYRGHCISSTWRARPQAAFFSSLLGMVTLGCQGSLENCRPSSKECSRPDGGGYRDSADYPSIPYPIIGASGSRRRRLTLTAWQISDMVGKQNPCSNEQGFESTRTRATRAVNLFESARLDYTDGLERWNGKLWRLPAHSIIGASESRRRSWPGRCGKGKGK